jgi:hypothetical protein
MKDDGVRLTSGELAVLDSLITVAQRAGYSLDVSDEEDCDNHVCAEHSDEFMGRWQDTRHDGVLFAYVEHDILPRLQQLLRSVDKPTALRRLMELRGIATRNR